MDFLLSKGLSQSWLVGNSLVTITTSAGLREDCFFCLLEKNKDTIEEKNRDRDAVSIISENLSSISKEVEANYAVVEKALDLPLQMQRDDKAVIAEVENQCSASPNSQSHASSARVTPEKVVDTFQPVKEAGQQSLEQPHIEQPIKPKILKRVVQSSASSYSIKSVASNKSLQFALPPERNYPSNDSQASSGFARDATDAKAKFHVGSEGNEDENVPPLVAELTQKLVLHQNDPHNIFSPSEELLFSRQASKNFDCISIMTDEDDSEVNTLSDKNLLGKIDENQTILTKFQLGDGNLVR